MICPRTTQLDHTERHVRRSRAAMGMSLLELMVVVVIIALIVSMIVVGVNSARTNMRITSTRATLDLLETIVDEYYVQTEHYFDATTSAEQMPAPPNAGFLQTVEGVGEIYSLTGSLPKETVGAVDVVVDAWGRPIWFYSSGDSTPPVFWSDGPDETDTSAARPWETGQSYAIGDLVGYKSNVYVCINAHASANGNEPVEQGTAEWELTDGIGTFK